MTGRYECSFPALVPGVLRKVSLICLGLALMCCSSGSGDTVDHGTDGPTAYAYSVPDQQNDGWAVASLENEGIDETDVTAMMDVIIDGTYPGIDGVLLVRNNRLILDERIRTSLDAKDAEVGNADIERHAMMSVTKSVLSAVAGIAIDQGAVPSTDLPVLDVFPQYPLLLNWDPRKETITLKNMLTMRHGFAYDEDTYPWGHPQNTLSTIFYGYSDYVKGTLDLPMNADPGTRFAYSSMVSHVIGAVVQDSVGISFEDFAQTWLFDRLDMQSAFWGYYSPAGRVNTGWGLFMNMRDMAKFGQLFLNGGEWNGEQIISRDWVDVSTARHVAFTTAFGRSGYGYQWWTHDFLVDGTHHTGFHAVGNGGQYIFVFPDLELIVVFTGHNYDSDIIRQNYELVEEYVLPAILSD